MALRYLKFSCSINPSITFIRHVRNAIRRSKDVRRVDGTVKTLLPYDSSDHFQPRNYEDLVKSVKSSTHITDIDIENALTNEDDFGMAISSARGAVGDEYFRTSKEHQSFIKKQIIGKKYFKVDFETNLLSYAAKQQIRYLYQLNSAEWTPEFLSQCFPITVTGVKKLVKCTFELSPERVKEHDEEVEKRWKILTSGEMSAAISPLTQRMWNEGKIIKENYKGNPKFPTRPAALVKTVINEANSPTGEFSAIIKPYVNYKKEKEASLKKLDSGVKDLEVRENSYSSQDGKLQKSSDMLNRNKYHIDSEQDNSEYSTSNRQHRKKGDSSEDLPYFQFKENLKEELGGDSYKSDPTYLRWLEKQPAARDIERKAYPVDSRKVFSKIEKYNKENVELQRDASKNTFYMYNDRFGYQHPLGTGTKSKIHLKKKSHKKDGLYKVGQCVYNENGDFLYKLPG